MAAYMRKRRAPKIVHGTCELCGKPIVKTSQTMHRKRCFKRGKCDG